MKELIKTLLIGTDKFYMRLAVKPYIFFSLHKFIDMSGAGDRTE